jgi:hypothetical protein
MPTPPNFFLPPDGAFLTPDEVSAYLRISRRELRRRQYALPPIRLGRRTLRYRAADVRAYLGRLGGGDGFGPQSSRRVRS